MRLVVACCSLSMAAALCGCASTDGRVQGFHSGSGSANGNYGAQAEGEMRGPAGERCIVFNWDRPLTRDLAVRLKSASCESKTHPFWMDTRELSRTVIPLSESNARDGSNDP